MNTECPDTKWSDTNGNRRAGDPAARVASCSEEQIGELREIARSTTAGIWRIKRAKIILGALEGKSVDRLVLDVRVPPVSIIECLRRFAEEGMSYFEKPDRGPTAREASVERILDFLDHPRDPREEGWDTLTHRYIGIWFSARRIKVIRDLLSSNPGNTRVDLAREICTRFELYQPNGKLRLATVVDILKRMDMDNIIALPPIPHRSLTARMHIRSSLAAPREMMKLDPRDIEDLRFVPVTTPEEGRQWNEIICHHHYIKAYRLFGPRMRYLVYRGKAHGARLGQAPSGPQNGTDGYPVEDDGRGLEADRPGDEHLLAVLGFAGSAWRLSSRDDFIGWTEEQRVANLRYVVGNARFLIFPWIRCPNLASRILGGVAKRLPGDWEERYHYRPVLLETFVQLDRFTGTCYKAANWIPLGTTTGYSLYNTREKSRVPRKAVFVYPLTKRFRKVLCSTDHSE